MQLENLDLKKDSFENKELDAMVKCLTLAEEIKADVHLYGLVKDHMKKQVKKIKSVSDLRAKLNTFELEAKQ